MADKLVKNVFGWDHFLLYLSGVIDCDRDGGRVWRDEWTVKLMEIGIPSNQILNPCRKPLKGAQFNLDDEAEIMDRHRKNRDWAELHRVMSQITHVDLRLCDLSSIVLVNMPKRGRTSFEKTIQKFDKSLEELRSIELSDEVTKCLDKLNEAFLSILMSAVSQQIPTYGTIHEIVEARRQRKPVFMVWEGGKEECSAWLMWLVGHRNIFTNVDDLMTRLENISKGKTAYNAKDWLLLDLDIENEYNEIDKENQNGTN